MVAWTIVGKNRGGERSGQILGGFKGRDNKIY